MYNYIYWCRAPGRGSDPEGAAPGLQRRGCGLSPPEARLQEMWPEETAAGEEEEQKEE